ncbi:hypothetical protein VPHD518_0052 [Vibrio phage D518]
MIQTYLPMIQIVAACWLLAKGCGAFEQAANYFGRNMPAGIKGATVNAVGSSMPEMMSGFVLLFWYNDPAAFAIALGITAGSGVFNTAVIPPLAIWFAKDKEGKPVKNISLNPANLRRDVAFVVITDVLLIGLLFYGYISVGWAISLNLIYVLYALIIWMDSKNSSADDIDDYEEEELHDYGNPVSNFFTCNFKSALIGSKPLGNWSAFFVFSLALVVITFGSHVLVEGVMGASNVLGIPDFISGLILGAAASSLPDTIISVQDAKKGNYEDAIANPLASNTFDTSISLGLPLLLWLLWTGNDGIEIVGENMEALRISVVAMSASVGLSLIYKHKHVTRSLAAVIFGAYVVWMCWIGFTFI